MDYKEIKYQGASYLVIPREYNGETYYCVMDKDKEYIINNGRSWHLNHGYLSQCDSTKVSIDLHRELLDSKTKDRVYFLNKIKIDCRMENLTQNKNFSKDKQERKDIILGNGVNNKDLPAHVSYYNARDRKGEYFQYKITGIISKTKKSTSSKKISLKIKFEQIKRFLRHFYQDHPEIFEYYSIDNSYTKKGKELYHNYYDIIQSAGYGIIKPELNDNEYFKYINADYSGLSKEDIRIIEDFEIR